VSSGRFDATKHGLLAKQLVFRNEDEAEEFKALIDDLEKDFAPEGAVQGMLVEEIAVTWWKLRIAVGWSWRTWRIGGRPRASCCGGLSTTPKMRKYHHSHLMMAVPPRFRVGSARARF
jgi:hypothetical protein